MAFEQLRQEFSEKEQQLIALLREKGPEDPEARAMFDAWVLEEEARAMAENTSRADIERPAEAWRSFIARPVAIDSA